MWRDEFFFDSMAPCQLFILSVDLFDISKPVATDHIVFSAIGVFRPECKTLKNCQRKLSGGKQLKNNFFYLMSINLG